MGFEIVDKRGANKEVETAAEPWSKLAATVAAEDHSGSYEFSNGPDDKVEHTPLEHKKTVRNEVQKWRSVGYVMVKMPTAPGQELMLLRAVGMRTDEGVFHADYALPPVWGEGEDYAAEAKKRLDTFLACSCDAGGACKFHAEALPRPGRAGKWLEEDVKRLQKIQSEPLPEAVEFLMRSEAARAQQRVVVPGRG